MPATHITGRWRRRSTALRSTPPVTSSSKAASRRTDTPNGSCTHAARKRRLPPRGSLPQVPITGTFGTSTLAVRFLSTTGENGMDWNRIEGNWKQFKGNVKEKWGKLTDDDINVINGRRDQLEGKAPGTLRSGDGPSPQGCRRLV